MIEIYSRHPPISVNAMYRSAGKFGTPVKSARYRTWIKAVGHDLEAQKPDQSIKGEFVATITLDALKWRANSDIDNRAKCVLDQLQEFGFIENDKFCRDLRLRFANIVSGGFIVRLDKFTDEYQTLEPRKIEGLKKYEILPYAGE